MNAETSEVKDSLQYLKKADGTQIILMQAAVIYDAASYEPSEEMARLMYGAEETFTVIADLGTDL